jgi:hypothetical protein
MRCVRAIPRTRWTYALAAFVACASTVSGSAGAASESFTMRVTPAGTKAALAVTPSKADLGKASTWTGGFVTANPVTDRYCKNYRPRYSDLVVTGTTTVQYIGHGVYLRSQAKVLRTKDMVKLHWQRSLRSPNWFACTLASEKLMGGSSHFVSLRRLAIPGTIAPYSVAYRVISEVTTATGKVRVALDTLEIASGRTEITLSASAPLAKASGLLPSELILGKALLGRATV